MRHFHVALSPFNRTLEHCSLVLRHAVLVVAVLGLATELLAGHLADAEAHDGAHEADTANDEQDDSIGGSIALHRFSNLLLAVSILGYAIAHI